MALEPRCWRKTFKPCCERHLDVDLNATKRKGHHVKHDGPLIYVQPGLCVFSQSRFHFFHGCNFDLTDALGTHAIFGGQLVQCHAA